jgi:hypothetical protein
MSDDLDEILDSVFHGCALAAYCHQAAEEGRWPPDSEATKQRFNRYYEEELAKKNRAKALAPADSSRSALDRGSCVPRIVSYETKHPASDREDHSHDRQPDAPHLYEPGRRL